MRLDKDAELSKKLYNEQAVEYSKTQSQYRVVQVLRRQLLSIMGKVRQKRILFAGCGDGLECLPAARKGAIVTGVDVSEGQISLARSNCPKGKFFVRDFEHTHFKGGNFDLVVSMYSIMYKKDLKRVFREFKRILKHNGNIILVVPHPVHKMYKYKLATYFTRGKRWKVWKGVRRFNYYRLLEDYIDAIVASNLRIVKILEPKPVKETDKTPFAEVNHPHVLVFKLSVN